MVTETPLVLPSLRSRGGRRFEAIHELELEPDALEAAASLPGAHRGVVVVREMAGPFGVPDLVAVVGSPAGLAQRVALPVPPLLNQIDAGVVAASAPRAARSAQTLARRVGFPLHSVERRLPISPAWEHLSEQVRPATFDLRHSNPLGACTQ